AGACACCSAPLRKRREREHFKTYRTLRYRCRRKNKASGDCVRLARPTPRRKDVPQIYLRLVCWNLLFKPFFKLNNFV
ncbi:MAG: hypothetical protein ACP5RR_10050, partial [Candidatus Kapaibacteriota bacterium]